VPRQPVGDTIGMRSQLSVLITLVGLTLGLAPEGLPSAASAAPVAPGTVAEDQRSERARLTGARRKVVVLTNQRRVRHGCRPVKAVRSLNVAAQRHTRRMARADRLDHQLPGEPSVGQRLRNAGYDWTMYGENIAYGYPTARAVVRAWMRSAGHRRNILTCRFRHIGVGLAWTGSGRPYWTQDFGRR
jgi:uncharacterized protein YkwD